MLAGVLFKLDLCAQFIFAAGVIGVGCVKTLESGGEGESRHRLDQCGVPSDLGSTVCE